MQNFDHVVKHMPGRNMGDVYQYYLGTYKHDSVQYREMKGSVKVGRALSMKNSSFCAICEDGGDLLCCDRCELAFHVGCLGEAPPLGDEEWMCEICVEKKFYELCEVIKGQEGVEGGSGGVEGKNRRARKFREVVQQEVLNWAANTK